CHVQFPKLNAFGEAFRRNGYQFPGGADDEALRQQPVTLVPEERRATFPRSYWPSDLAASFPAALILDAAVPIFPDESVRPVGEQVLSFDKLYGEAKLVVAARFGRDVSGFGEVQFDSTGGLQLPRAWLTVDNLFAPAALHVRVGQFEPQIAS